MSYHHTTQMGRNQKVDCSTLDDAELTHNIQNDINVQESLQVLIDRHSGIYYTMISKYIPEGGKFSSINIDKDLIIDSRDYIIYEAAKNYNPNKKTKFSTYLGNTTSYFCLNHINKNRIYVNYEPNNFENIFKEQYDEIDLNIDEDIINRVIDVIREMPDERVYKIFQLRYLESKGKRPTPWSKIEGQIPHANNRKKFLTIQGCINLHNKALCEVRKFLNEQDK